jgi:glycosyltransferase involved in cell wall biosynthesis
MNILYHHRTLGDGAEGIHVSSMVEAFRGLGHDVRIAAMIGERTNVATTRTRLFQQVRRWTPQPAFEILELAYGVAGSQRLIAEIARWPPSVIYERYMLFNTAGVTAAERFKIPLLLEVNAPLAWERARYERLSLKRTARRYERMICSRADRVLVVSTPLKEYLANEGVPEGRIAVVPNGADPERFRPLPDARARMRERLSVKPDELVVGFSGILRPWHGVELLIDAAAALPPAVRRRVRLLIVGDGPSRATLGELAAKRGLANAVIFSGRVPHSEVPEYLAAFDVGVSPRATFYASPMKVPEYMAMGIPVIAPRTPNLKDLIDDGRTGTMFEPEKADALASALTELLESQDTRERLASAARREIVDRRTWRHIALRALDGLSRAEA